MLRSSFIIAIVTFISSHTFAQQADEIIGKYHLPNDLDIEIFKKGDKYFGKIIALNNFEDGQTKDVNNPEESRQNDDLVGKVIIENLEYDQEKKQWLNGNMYGPEKGMVFNLKITEMREHEIEVVGSKFILWHTLQWEKI
ncbi:MAG: DUF2147 domain-containing protein [Bacteroidales bacterium]|nr:DUF2147 domain-containing protein [Bacteroidales bacterium]MCF6341794.1 DUF2147 domain-containing protein [Bacteroidales bacterium]